MKIIDIQYRVVELGNGRFEVQSRLQFAEFFGLFKSWTKWDNVCLSTEDTAEKALYWKKYFEGRHTVKRIVE